MPNEVKEIGPCKYLLKIEVPPAQIKEKLESQYQDFIKESVIAGFRKGRAPRSLVERKFGKDILEKAKLDLIGDSYDAVLKEKDLTPITEPKLEADKIVIEQGKPLSFEVEIEVEPKINLKEYTGVSIKRVKAEVTEKDMDEAIARLKESKAELVPVKDTAVKEGDHLVVDEEILSVSDKPELHNQPIARQENTSLRIDPGQIKPELAKDLVGAKVGDTREIKITLPKDYARKEWRGTAALAKLTVKEIKRLKLPKLTDAWAKELNFESLAHLKEEIKKRLVKSKEKEAEHQMEDQIIEQIVKQADLTLPETMIQRGAEYFLKQQKVNLYLQGVPEDQLAQEIEKYRSVSQEAATASIKTHRVLEYIAQKEKIFVTEEEIGQWINERAKTTGRWPNEIKTYYEKNNLMGSLRSELKEGKVRKLLREKAVITD